MVWFTMDVIFYNLLALSAMFPRIVITKDRRFAEGP